MATTIEIDDNDHARFIAAKLKYAAKTGKQISHPDFFSIVIGYWEKGKV